MAIPVKHKTRYITEVEVDNKLAVKAFPNPADELLNIQIKSAPSGNYQLQLFGLDGRLYRSESRELPNGDYIWRIQTGDLASGMYLLRLQSPEGIQTIKIIRD